MNIAEWSIRNSVITWVLTVLMAVVGVASFGNLSLLEDPEFTIKEAIIITPYPGASAAEVEEEVTNVIEQAIQELGQLGQLDLLPLEQLPGLLDRRVTGLLERTEAFYRPRV